VQVAEGGLQASGQKLAKEEGVVCCRELGVQGVTVGNKGLIGRDRH